MALDEVKRKVEMTDLVVVHGVQHDNLLQEITKLFLEVGPVSHVRHAARVRQVELEFRYPEAAALAVHIFDGVILHNRPLKLSLKRVSSADTFITITNCSADETHLRKAFARFGRVLAARFLPPAFAWVQFSRREEALKVLAAFPEQIFMGRKVYMDITDEKPVPPACETVLAISNLSEQTKEEELEDICREFGQVLTLDLDSEKGTAQVVCPSTQTAHEIKQVYNGVNVNGKPIKITLEDNNKLMDLKAQDVFCDQTVLIVSNLSPNTNLKKLTFLFEEIGPIQRSRFLAGDNKAEIVFLNKNEAEEAKEIFQGVIFDSHPLVLSTKDAKKKTASQRKPRKRVQFPEEGASSESSNISSNLNFGRAKKYSEKKELKEKLDLEMEEYMAQRGKI